MATTQLEKPEGGGPGDLVLRTLRAMPRAWNRFWRLVALYMPKRLYARSLDDARAFWLEQAKRLDWATFPTKTDESSFDEADFQVKWFADGELNVAANCLDRHLATRGGDLAIIWEPDVPGEEPRRFTYAQVHEEVCRFTNVAAYAERRASRSEMSSALTARSPSRPSASETGSPAERSAVTKSRWRSSRLMRSYFARSRSSRIALS